MVERSSIESIKTITIIWADVVDQFWTTATDSHAPCEVYRDVMVFCIVRISNRTARNRVPELWFEDDNLILHAENTVFRVSKGVLAAHSSVFRDMLSFPQTVYVSYQSDRAISIQGVSKVSVGILRVGYEQGLNSRQDINQD
jgi:hypothetical protein